VRVADDKNFACLRKAKQRAHDGATLELGTGLRGLEHVTRSGRRARRSTQRPQHMLHLLPCTQHARHTRAIT
jgi:hypothetical protein